MKRLALILGITLAAARVFSAPVIRNEGNGVTFAKWQLTATGEAFYTDAERDAVIASRNVFSSTGIVLSAGSFTNVSPSADVIALTTTVYSGSIAGLTVTNMSVEALYRPYYDTGKSDGTGYQSFKEALDDQLNFKIAIENLGMPYAERKSGLDTLQTIGINLLARRGRANGIIEFIRRIYPSLQ